MMRLRLLNMRNDKVKLDDEQSSGCEGAGGASPSKDDRGYEQDKEAGGRWGVQLPVILVLCLLLAFTQYLLRHDNNQLKMTAMVIRELQHRESETRKELPSHPKPVEARPADPNCERDLQDVRTQLASAKLKSQNLERMLHEQETARTTQQQQVTALAAEKQQLHMQMTNLEKEKRLLSKRLGVKAAEAEAEAEARLAKDLGKADQERQQQGGAQHVQGFTVA